MSTETKFSVITSHKFILKQYFGGGEVRPNKHLGLFAGTEHRPLHAKHVLKLQNYLKP